MSESDRANLEESVEDVRLSSDVLVEATLESSVYGEPNPTSRGRADDEGTLSSLVEPQSVRPLTRFDGQYRYQDRRQGGQDSSTVVEDNISTAVPAQPAADIDIHKLALQVNESSLSLTEDTPPEKVFKDLRTCHQQAKQLAQGVLAITSKQKYMESQLENMKAHVEYLKDKSRDFEATCAAEIKKVTVQYRCLEDFVAYEQCETSKCPVCLKVVNPNICVVCDQPQTSHDIQDDHKFKERKLIESHPYTQAVLENFFGADFFGIWDYLQDRRLKPSTCKWKHLCYTCDSATTNAERNFLEVLETALSNPSQFKYRTSSGYEILVEHADLFHVYTYRALCHNVDIFHYSTCDEKKQQCSCNQLFFPLHKFLMRARRISHPLNWSKKNSKEYTSPAEAGMLFQIIPSTAPGFQDHLIEFPLICRVEVTSLNKEIAVVFGQIPPFYWAFLLPFEQAYTEESFSQEIKSSPQLVEAECPVATDEAQQLVEHFPDIICKVNEELKKMRAENPTSNQVKWLESLQKLKSELESGEQEIQEKKSKLNGDNNEIRGKKNIVREKMSQVSLEQEVLAQKLEQIKSKECSQSQYARRKQTQEVIVVEGKIQKLGKEYTVLHEESNVYDKKSQKIQKEIESLNNDLRNLVNRGLYSDCSPKLFIGLCSTGARSCCLQVVV